MTNVSKLTQMQRDRRAQLSVEIELLLNLSDDIVTMANDGNLNKQDIVDYLYNRYQACRAEFAELTG